MKALAEKYTLYVPDLPGFGHSQGMTGDFYVPELVSFLHDFTRTLGLESFYLMGHSLGGGVAASYALQHPPRVKKLVLVDSMCLGPEIALWVRVFSAPALIRSLGKAVVAVLKGVKWLAKAMFQSVEFIIPLSQASLILGASAVTLQAQTVVLLHRLSEIAAPTLVVWGERDRIVPVKHAYAAATLIPDCVLKVYEGGGHSAYKERLPEFSRLLMGFLEREG